MAETSTVMGWGCINKLPFPRSFGSTVWESKQNLSADIYAPNVVVWYASTYSVIPVRHHRYDPWHTCSQCALVWDSTLTAFHRRWLCLLVRARHWRLVLPWAGFPGLRLGISWFLRILPSSLLQIVARAFAHLLHSCGLRRYLPLKQVVTAFKLYLFKNKPKYNSHNLQILTASKESFVPNSHLHDSLHKRYCFQMAFWRKELFSPVRYSGRKRSACRMAGAAVYIQLFKLSGARCSGVFPLLAISSWNTV